MFRSIVRGAAATTLVAAAMSTVGAAPSVAARAHAAASCGTVSAMGAVDAVTVTVSASGVSCPAAKTFVKKYYAGPHLSPALPAGWSRHGSGASVSWTNGSKRIAAKSGARGCFTPSGSPKPC